MKIVVHLILPFLFALVVPFNSLTWFQSDLKAVFFSCNNIRYSTVCTIIIYPEIILQNQEKDAVRSARKARVIAKPVLGNLIESGPKTGHGKGDVNWELISR